MFQLAVRHPIACNLFLSVVITCAVGLFWHLRSPHYLEEKRELQLQAKVRHVRSVVRGWNLLPLVRLNDSLTAKYVDQMHIEQVAVMSSTQRALLLESVLNLFKYIREPSFEGFCELHSNSSGNRILFDGFLETQMRHFNNKGGIIFPSDKREALNLLWHLNSTNKYFAIPPRIESISTNGLRTFVTQTVSTNGTAHRRATSICTFVHAISPSGFAADETPATINGSGGTNLFADVFFFARTSASENTGPFIFSYYWSPRRAVWIPYRSFCDAQTKYQTMF